MFGRPFVFLKLALFFCMAAMSNAQEKVNLDLEDNWLNLEPLHIHYALEQMAAKGLLDDPELKLVLAKEERKYAELFIQLGRRQQEGNLTGKERDKLLEVARANQVDAICQQLKPTTVLNAIQYYNAYRLEVHLTNNSEDVACLLLPELSSALALDDVQLEKLNKLAKELALKKDKAKDELVALLDKQLAVNKNHLMKLLAHNQKDRFQGSIGLPVPWYALSDQQELLDTAANLTQNVKGKVEVRSVKIPGVTRDDVNLKRQEYENAKNLRLPEWVPYSFYSVLISEDIWKQCEVIEEQKQALRQYIKDIDQYSVVVNEPQYDRIKELISGEANSPEGLDHILEPMQIKWLHQVELQVWLIEFRDSVGLLSPAISQLLDLNESQKRNIQDRAKQFSDKAKENISAFDEEIKLLNEETRKAMYDTLTNNQKTLYKRLVGERDTKTPRQK
jgi:G:T/U-mismatch repair DNA glycosylase